MYRIIIVVTVAILAQVHICKEECGDFQSCIPWCILVKGTQNMIRGYRSVHLRGGGRGGDSK